MDSDNDQVKTKAKANPRKMLQIHSTQEFPSLLSSHDHPVIKKPVVTPNWGSLFASQAPNTPPRIHHPSLPPLPVTPTKEMSSPKSNAITSIEEKDSILLSPTTAECMSILSNETGETAVERDETSTPWGSPIADKEGDVVVKDEDLDTTATAVFPDLITMDKTTTPQKEPLPPFEFPATEVEPNTDLNNASPMIPEAKIEWYDELCEAERHDTPSYISGRLDLHWVVDNDPHRVMHAIKSMIHNNFALQRRLGASQEELDAFTHEYQAKLRDIDMCYENLRLASLPSEKNEAAIKEARLTVENTRTAAAQETEYSKSPTKFNPDAKPFSPSNSMPPVFVGPASSFTCTSIIQAPSPLKYSDFQRPGFMVEQSRTPSAQAKFHPLLNRSRTWSMHRSSRFPAGPYGHFHGHNQRPISPTFYYQIPASSPMVLRVPWDRPTNFEVDTQEGSFVRSPSQSPTPMQSPLDLPMEDRHFPQTPQHLRIPVSGKTDHKSTPTSPTRGLSVNTSFRAMSTNTSPLRRAFNVRSPYPSQPYQSNPQSSKVFIPTPRTAEDIQEAVLRLPRTHRHICPSSLTSPDFKCPMPNCMLQQICPFFTSENGCSFRPPPLSDWPWNYPPRDPPINQSQQCPFVHIPGTCLHSLSFFRSSGSSFESPTDNSPYVYPAPSSHYCPINNCAVTRFHSWGCAKDWKTGFAIDGLTPIGPAHNITICQAANEIPSEWKWRVAMESLRFAHERGEYGCQGGKKPFHAVFPANHKGNNPKNWGQPFNTSCKPKSNNGNGKASAREKERGRLRGGAGGLGGTRGKGSRARSSDTKRKLARENSTRSA